MYKFLFTVLLLMCAIVQASQTSTVTADAELEKRVMVISEELRCLVCQNQTIADSHADLAIDLRNQVREMLVQGKSNKEVSEYMVQRYGDFVLYRPPVKSTTWLLWFGPFLLLIGGIGFLAMRLKSRQSTDQTAQADELSERDMKRAAELLRSGADIKETT